jgi:hypothetical protein
LNKIHGFSTGLIVIFALRSVPIPSSWPLSGHQQAFNKANYDVVEAKAHFNSVFPGNIIAIFNAQKWHARVAMHRVGDQIVAFCQFKEIEREQVLTNIHRLWFYGIRCDLPER